MKGPIRNRKTADGASERNVIPATKTGDDYTTKHS